MGKGSWSRLKSTCCGMLQNPHLQYFKNQCRGMLRHAAACLSRRCLPRRVPFGSASPASLVFLSFLFRRMNRTRPRARLGTYRSAVHEPDRCGHVPSTRVERQIATLGTTFTMLGTSRTTRGGYVPPKCREGGGSPPSTTPLPVCRLVLFTGFCLHGTWLPYGGHWGMCLRTVAYEMCL